MFNQLLFGLWFGMLRIGALTSARGQCIPQGSQASTQLSQRSADVWLFNNLCSMAEQESLFPWNASRVEQDWLKFPVAMDFVQRNLDEFVSCKMVAVLAGF